MTQSTPELNRIFTTAWFAKAAAKAGIENDHLCDAARQVRNGQVDDLGGGVFKKRLNKNRHRAIILSKDRQRWIYVYLFAKNDRKNIDDAELAAFRKLAKRYMGMTSSQITMLLDNGDLMEICDD